MSPDVEEQYKVLTRDYDNAQRIYQDLLAKKSTAELALNMENQQQGEQMTCCNRPTCPTRPAFPTACLPQAAWALVWHSELRSPLWLELSDNRSAPKRCCGGAGSAAAGFRALGGRGMRKTTGWQWQW